MKTPIKMGEDLLSLQQTSQWQTVADIIEQNIISHKRLLVKFKLGASIEQIAVERIKLVSMIESLELLCQDFNDCIQAFQDNDKQEEEERKVSFSNKKKKLKITNPYREE